MLKGGGVVAGGSCSGRGVTAAEESAELGTACSGGRGGCQLRGRSESRRRSGQRAATTNCAHAARRVSILIDYFRTAVKRISIVIILLCTIF